MKNNGILSEFDELDAPKTGAETFVWAALGKGNAARALAKHALDAGSKDNLSTIVVGNLKQGQGDSLALCLCDGNGMNGHMVSQTGIETFQHVIASAYGQEAGTSGLWQDRARDRRGRQGGRG